MGATDFSNKGQGWQEVDPKFLEPTKEQFKKYLDYVNGLTMFKWIHEGDQPANPDLVAVHEWLRSKTEEQIGD